MNIFFKKPTVKEALRESKREMANATREALRESKREMANATREK